MEDFELKKYRKLLKDEISIPKSAIRIAVVGPSLPENNKFIHKIVEFYGIPLDPLPDHCFRFRDVFPNVDCVLHVQPPEKFSRLVRPPYWKRCHGLVILYSLHDDIAPNGEIREYLSVVEEMPCVLAGDEAPSTFGSKRIDVSGTIPAPKVFQLPFSERDLLPYFQVSTETGENLVAAFHSLIRRVHESDNYLSTLQRLNRALSASPGVTHLDVKVNNLLGDFSEFGMLIRLLRTTTSLQSLSCGISTTEENIGLLAYGLSKNTTLRTISLSNDFSLIRYTLGGMYGYREFREHPNPSAPLLIRQLKRHPTLTEIHFGSISQKKIGGAAVQLLKSKQQLISFSLGDTNLNAAGRTALGRVLRRHRSLKHLELSNTYLMKEGYSALGAGLKKNTILASLKINESSNYKEGPERFEMLIQYIEKGTLQTLQMKYYGKLIDDQTIRIARSLKHNTTLTALELNCGTSSDIVLPEFTNALLKNVTLKELRFSTPKPGYIENEIDFLRSIQAHPGLTSLSLTTNHAHRESLIPLLMSIAKFHPTIIVLKYFGNGHEKISRQVKKKIANGNYYRVKSTLFELLSMQLLSSPSLKMECIISQSAVEGNWFRTH